MNGREKYLALRQRLKSFALRVLNLYDALPNTKKAQVMGTQVIRSATSVGAQFCEAHRAKSKADFISKMQGSIQELEETLYWFELLVESGLVKQPKLEALIKEANELLAILTAIIKGTKGS